MRSDAPLVATVAATTRRGTTDVNKDFFCVGDLGKAPRHGPDDLATRIASTSGLAFGLYDGMGGKLGQLASRETGLLVHEHLVAPPIPTTSAALATRLAEAIDGANRMLFAKMVHSSAWRGVASAATVATLVEDDLCLAHVGQTRAFLLRGGRLAQLNRVYCQINPDLGPWTPYKAQVLGMKEWELPAPERIAMRSGDVLVLCTQGLDALPLDAIEATLRFEPEPAPACHALLDQDPGLDLHDSTILIARFDDGLPPAGPTEVVEDWSGWTGL